jgi:hypothetical protein
MNERGLTRAEASLDSQNGWHDYVLEQGEDLLLTQVDSWFTGINSNIDGRQTRITAIYRGSMQSFRSRCEEVAQNGYKELDLR